MNFITKISIIVLLSMTLLLSGCAIQGSNHTDPQAVVATSSTAAVSDPLLKGFGSVITYKDGTSVSVSVPTTYSPSAQAAGVVEGQTNLVFTVVVTNGSKKSLDIAGFPQLNSGGKSASGISDIGNNVGDTPATTLLSGQSITWQVAYSVVDPTDLTFIYAPGLDYFNAIFNSNK